MYTTLQYITVQYSFPASPPGSDVVCGGGVLLGFMLAGLWQVSRTLSDKGALFLSSWLGLWILFYKDGRDLLTLTKGKINQPANFTEKLRVNKKLQPTNPNKKFCSLESKNLLCFMAFFKACA